jgi:glycosyltransferase involved in cell wall biosynthesis
VSATGVSGRAAVAPQFLRAAVVFVNYGPYHVARSLALAQQPGIDPVFIEITSFQKKYPWRADKSRLNERLVTLTDRPYEENSAGNLSRKLINVLVEKMPHVLVLAGYSDAPMRAAARWARSTGIPVVMMGCSTEEDHQRRWWREELKRLWLRRYVHAALVAGRASRRYWIKLGIPEKLIWDGYDVVDNDYFASRTAELRAALEQTHPPAPYFLYVGRFAPEKNLPVLLRAYQRYRERHPDGWRLVMVGDGPQRAELQSLAAECGLADIVWPGFKHFDELPHFYAFAGCLVLPSVMEPWGLVVNEAMACGLPVLVSRKCGCAADLVVEGANGYTFDPADIDALADRLAMIAATSPERRSQMMRHSSEIISRWTPQTWAAQLASAVRSVARG